MSILSAENVSLSFGDRDIFSGISASIPEEARIGLVGPNGVGKTSLLRIIAGVSPPSSGSVDRGRECRVGYLRQEAVEAFAGHEHSVYDEMLTVFAHLRAQADSLRAMEARMAAGETSEEFLHAYGTAQEQFEHGGGYDYEVRIRQVLEGLGFPRPLWSVSISHLSGGQKTRALLARLLLERPTLLILDEPTNHLDVQAVEWLENTLRSWDGTLLIVSHDRYFLDNVVNRIWEMSPTHIESYRGNYSAYVMQRQERWERSQKLFDSEKERLVKEMELVKRYIGWRRFDEAKGKLKRLSRELVAIEQGGPLALVDKTWAEVGVGRTHMMSVEEAERRVKEIKPPTRPPMLKIRLRSSGRSGTIVLRTRALTVGYPGTPLFEAGDLRLERLERVALIGPNGSGKSTFLRTVLGQLEPLSGEVLLGVGLKIGYFAQAHDGLNPQNTVLDELMSHKKGLTLGEARNYLAQYLFRGDDVFKPVGALSGGERGRLALAVLALEGVNLLLLDEPTNHLDIPAQEVLQEGLESFDGTMLIVSHDRYLVDRLATQVWELADGRLQRFEGSYQEMLAARTLERQAAEDAARAQRQATRAADAPSRNGKPAPSRNGKPAAQHDVSTLERRIGELESLLAEYSHKLQEGSEAGRYDEVAQLGASYTSAQAELDGLMHEWVSLSAE